MPQITVLIPTYNCGAYLRDCLNSIIKQTYTDYEVILIDDGSTDDTEIIVRDLDLPSLRYYKNNKNIGIVKTLNKGLKLAKGRYIARMDADDIMLGNRLEEQFLFLEKNPEYGMVGGSYHIIDYSGFHLNTVITKADPDFLSLAILFRNQFHHATIMMRTDIARQLKYCSKFPFCEDHELWFRFSKVSKITNLPCIYLNYRWHPDNSCNKNQSTLKTSLLSLLSRELNKIGVKHTTNELMLHGSVCFGLAPFKFKDSHSLAELQAWYYKIFNSRILARRYPSRWLISFKKNILKNYCGVYFNDL